jgi:hypothetical protein
LLLIGPTTSLVATDVGRTAPYRFTQFEGAVTNRAPIADAGPDQIVECTGDLGTSVTLNASNSSDPDGDTLTFAWRNSANQLVATTAAATLSLPLGVHTFTVTVNDGKGGTASDSVVINVRDTTPPTLRLTVSPDVLLVPNHKLVLVTIGVQVADVCDANPIVSLVSITNSEPDNGLGDGDTPNDIQGAALGTDDRVFFLRAERSGLGIGRTYTIIYSAKDASGNISFASAQVRVPRSKDE